MSSALQALQIYSARQLKILLEQGGFEALQQADIDGSELKPLVLERILTVAKKMRRNRVDPNNKFPMANIERLCFLKNIVTHPNIIVGDYTYYDDPVSVDNFNHNVLYQFDFMGDKLIIGKFCQIATGVKFIMNGANHATDGFSTFPFRAFGGDWNDVPLTPSFKGDTIVGNDVWLGYKAIIMPGIQIGDGAIIASGSIVTKDVAPYSIVGGNPATLIRNRFDDETIAKLIKLAWWNWSFEKITEHANAIAGADKVLFKN
jgi:virginiamycin A acetyltransferase